MINVRRTVISDCGRYRYVFYRPLGLLGDRPCGFGLLNPSIADGRQEDPTARRAMGYGRAWHCNELFILNPNALRSTDPKALYSAADPVGPDNEYWVRAVASYIAERGGIFVCGWGNHGGWRDQDQVFLTWLRESGVTPCFLRMTKEGHPAHPLYLPAHLKPQVWHREAA